MDILPLPQDTATQAQIHLITKLSTEKFGLKNATWSDILNTLNRHFKDSLSNTLSKKKASYLIHELIQLP